MECVIQTLRRLVPRKIFRGVSPLYHFFMAFWAALFYGFPSRRLIVIGVTGTKGKTTVVRLLHHILASSGTAVASLSSLGTRIGDVEKENPMKMTMPGRMAIQRFLHDARRAGAEYAIIEVTSEGIRQFRHRFIKFQGAIVTGIHPEHIESHGSFEAYLRAKLDLFWRLPKNATAVINKDDGAWERFVASTQAAKVFYSASEITAGGKPIPVRHVSISRDGIEFDLGQETIVSPLLGEFNLLNILAAISFATARHISIQSAALAIKTFSGVPGRMEFIQASPVSVVVDYAHTPESLKCVYEFLKNSAVKTPSARIICVLGAAGGGRDRWKRPEFGRIASQFCDTIVLTNEDPYDEDPAEIMREIQSGVLKGVAAEMILDRREAIQRALGGALGDDTVIITGKGAEQWIMGRNGEKTPWNEREIVREETKRIFKEKFNIVV